MAQYSCKSIILIPLYADDVLFSYTLDDTKHLLDVLETFCQISRLTVNVEKTKMTGMMGMTAIRSRHYPTFTYKGEPIQVVQILTKPGY